jgi:xanthine/uracil permease
MAISLTWRNVGVLVGLLGGLLVAMFSGTAAMMEWRMIAVQHQLDDRMSLYEREMDRLERRLDRLEK